MSYEFDRSIICPEDPSATPLRIRQYEEYYKVKHDLAKRFDPKVIVEIGVRAGYSAWAFLTACPRAFYHGFDAENGTHGGQGGPWTHWARKILSERRFNFRIYAPFDTQSASGLPIRADFYHIDGDHTPEGVYHDLDICFKGSLPGAVMLVDDYDYEEAAGVRIGVDKWIADNRDNIEHEHVPSLRGEMVIRKK